MLFAKLVGPFTLTEWGVIPVFVRFFPNHIYHIHKAVRNSCHSFANLGLFPRISNLPGSPVCQDGYVVRACFVQAYMHEYIVPVVGIGNQPGTYFATHLKKLVLQCQLDTRKVPPHRVEQARSYPSKTRQPCLSVAVHD